MDIYNLKKKIYTDNKLAFVFGNGVNRYPNDRTEISWENILLSIWNDLCSRPINKNHLEGMSLTEFYDILSLQAVDNNDIRDSFLKQITSLKPSDYNLRLTEKLIQINRPVLTTNFDNFLESNLQLRRLKYILNFTDYYPWDSYWSNQELRNPTEGFGIWHINGMTKYKRSIKLGLSEYTLLSSRAKDFIHSQNAPFDTFSGKNQSFWKGYSTWLHIIFNCNLLIIGLGLERDETFLRWLLIERAKYFERFTDRRCFGWYVDLEKQIKPGKKLFLESVGFEVVEAQSYREVYSSLFDISL